MRHKHLLPLFALILASVHTLAQISSGPMHKYSKVISHDNVCRVQINGLGDGTKMTGTGIGCTFPASVAAPNPNPNGWFGFVNKLEVSFNDQMAQIYPVGSEDPATDARTTVGRHFRYDSTQVAGALGETTVTVRLKVDFLFLRFGPPAPPNWLPSIIASEHDSQEVEVAPQAFNVGTINATTRDSPGLPSGWQGMSDLPEQYLWRSVSQLGATQARGLIPSANYALTAEDLHTYVQLAVSAAEYAAVAGNPSAIRALQLTKLLGQSTLLFNFSHGQTTGFSDDSNPLQLVDWTSSQRTTGPYMVSEFRNLMCRMAFLYSCSCGASPSAARSAFHMSDFPITPNTALLAFSAPVFSTLAAGNQEPDVPYNNSSGNITMTDKLSQHASKVLKSMAGGVPSGLALDQANNLFPPRKFSHGANGINYTDVLLMVNHGDSESTMHGIYRRATEDDSEYLQFGTWGLLDRLSEVLTEELP